jgi:predicted O-methyltransferase YrrM
MAFSTRVKTAVNHLLRPVRLQVSTTVLEEQESARLRALRASGYWGVPRYDQAIALDHKKFGAFLSEVCAGCRDGYTALAQGPAEAADGFYLRNNWFECVDAEMLYAVVRHFHPKRIIEVGSGFSTRLIRKAIGDGGLSTQLTCIDPQPRVMVQAYADNHIASRVEALSPSSIVEQLGENDILFIDSSHEIVQAGDVPFLFLEVLPRLRTNVLVHVHDIFFPFDYPERVLDQRWNWNEQYLVHAFLAYNPAFELLWPASYMWARWKQEVLEHIPVVSMGNLPSSLWLKKVQ